MLAVPSAIVPAESNYLLNPAHPDFKRIKIGKLSTVETDPRLCSRRTVNPQVPGSSPGRGAKSISALCANLAPVSTRGVSQNMSRESAGRRQVAAFRRY